MKINKKIIALLLMITVNLIIGSDDVADQAAASFKIEIDKINNTGNSPEDKLKSFEALRTKLDLKPNKAIERKLEAAELTPISDLALKKALSPATSLDFLADSFTKQRINNELRMTQLYLIQEKVRSTFGSNLDDITIDKIKDLLTNKWKDSLGLVEVLDDYKSDITKAQLIEDIKASKYTKELKPKILSRAKAAVITDEAVALAKKSLETSELKQDKAAKIIPKALKGKQDRVRSATEKLISEEPETELIAQVKKDILKGGVLSEGKNAILKKYLSKTGVTQEAFVKDLQLAEVANSKKFENKMASISDLNDKGQEGLLEKLKDIAKKSDLSDLSSDNKNFLKEIGFADDFLVEKSLTTFKKAYNDKIKSLYEKAGLSIPEIDLLSIDDKAISALKKQQKFKIQNQKFERRFADIAVLDFNEEVDKTQFKKLKAITKDSTKENLKAIDLDSDFVDSLTQEQLDSFKTLSVKLYNQAVAKLHSNLDLKPSLTVKQTAEQIFTRKKPITQFDKKPVREAQTREIEKSMRQLEVKKQEANNREAAGLRAKVATEEFEKLMAPKSVVTKSATTSATTSKRPAILNQPVQVQAVKVQSVQAGYTTAKFKKVPSTIRR